MLLASNVTGLYPCSGMKNKSTNNFVLHFCRDPDPFVSEGRAVFGNHENITYYIMYIRRIEEEFKCK
jgi:hypothetical protein